MARWTRVPVALAAVLTPVTAALVQCAPAGHPTPSTPTPSPQAQNPPSRTDRTAPAGTLPPETFTTVPPPRRARPAEVTPVTAAGLGATWRQGCPVGPDDLRQVELDYIGFDTQIHRGRLVVHRDLTDEVIAVFAQLVELRYPIEKMSTVDLYPGAEDELSMRDNNTSAFNCRGIPGSDSWSLHAYGKAVDINPKRNPYIPSSGVFEPANAGEWVDRSRSDPGMLHDGDAAVRAFTERGWRWGGHWRSPLDYQHFEMR